MNASEALQISKSKIPFLGEIIIGIKRQANRGLFQTQINYNCITKETIEKLKELGYKISKGGVDNYDYIIDWSE